MISVQYASTQVLQLKYYQLHKWFYFILLLIPAVKIALVLQSSHATTIQDSMLVSVVGPSFFPEHHSHAVEGREEPFWLWAAEERRHRRSDSLLAWRPTIARTADNRQHILQSNLYYSHYIQ